MSSLLAAPLASRFTFGSPGTTLRSLPADVTDTSAASTPTHGSGALHLPYAYAPSHPYSHPSSGLSTRSPTPDMGAMMGVVPALPAPSSSSAVSGYAPVRRPKDKQKHSESENRRRQRLRQKFTLLQQAAGVTGKKDRYSILQQAVDRLKELESRCARAEQEKAALSAQLAQSTLTSTVAGSALAAPSAVHPPLSTPLSNFQMLQHLPVCYISLDGRILDANQAFISLFRFAQGTGAQAGAPQADGSRDMLSPSAATAAAGGVNGHAAPTVPDIYTSSIFALTHHQELMATLTVLRDLLCGVAESLECARRCVDMRGRQIDCSMTVSSVTSAGKIVMFLCSFVPKAVASSATGASAPGLAHGLDASSAMQGTSPLGADALHATSAAAAATGGPAHLAPFSPHLSARALPLPHHPMPHHLSPTSAHRHMAGMVAFSSPTHPYAARPLVAHTLPVNAGAPPPAAPASAMVPPFAHHAAVRSPPQMLSSLGVVGAPGSSMHALPATTIESPKMARSSAGDAATQQQQQPPQLQQAGQAMDLSSEGQGVSSMLASPPDSTAGVGTASSFAPASSSAATMPPPPDLSPPVSFAPAAQDTPLGAGAPSTVPPVDASATAVANSFLDLATPPTASGASGANAHATPAGATSEAKDTSGGGDPSMSTALLDLHRPPSLTDTSRPAELTRDTSMSTGGFQLSPLESTNSSANPFGATTPADL